MKDRALLNWLRLVRDGRWSVSQKRQLLDKLGSPNAIYRASFSDLSTLVSGRRPKTTKGRLHTDAKLKSDLAWLSKSNHSIICFSDPNYPALLKEIADPPIALFAIGKVELLAEPKVAIVGSRRPTPIGTKVAQQMASELGQLGLVVTSGMALGIDGIAHQAALDTQEPTIAVMGCGLDTIYPSRNRVLFEQISQQGLVLTEYPLGVPASKYTFPQRNRIVSGLSYGVIIVEAAERSGTLITARLAVEQDREVMVLPGSSVSTQYAGSHRLIQQGACLVLNGADVLQNLAGDLQSELNRRMLNKSVSPIELQPGLSARHPSALANLSDERSLLQFISVESTTLDSIIRESGLTAAAVSSMLLILEIHGLIAACDDGGYSNIS